MASTEQPQDEAGVPARPSGGDRFVGVTLLLIALVFVAVQVLAGALIPPLAVPVVVYAALGVVLLRWRSRWLLIVVAVLTLLHVGASAQFFAASLTHPESPASFIPDALLVILALTVVVGAVAGLRQGRSRRPVGLAAGALAVAAIVVALVSAAGLESDIRQEGDVTVEAVDIEYPERVEVPADGAVWVDNQDPLHHTFVIEDADVHADVPAATAVRVTLELAPGTYRYFCDVPGHEQMEGELVVS